MIPFKKQVFSLEVKPIIFALSLGNHPLQRIPRKKIQALLEKRWGTSDYAWEIFNPCRTLPNKSSTVWYNSCKSWNMQKAALHPRVVYSKEEMLKLPLWSPLAMHRDIQEVSCKSSTQQRLREAGIRVYGDLVLHTGQELGR